MGRRINVGLIGLGRLGRIYARDLATRIPEVRLAAVADLQKALVESISAEYGVTRAYVNPFDLLDDRDVDAVVIVSPTSTHREIVIASVQRGKPTFCEKPPALSLQETSEMAAAVDTSGTMFQMGFMRRFDTGYRHAKHQVQQGAIGTPLVFKSSSRDQFPPSLEYADPAHSGGMIMDMGIHDFDLARWFMGEVATVHAVGAVLANPELESVGDIDNAIVTLVFSDGRLGIVDLARNGIYGYDISTEVLGSQGTVRIGYLRETPVLMMSKDHVAHDTVTSFENRFAAAYTAQLRDFALNVLNDSGPAIGIADGIEALRISLAATLSRQKNASVTVVGSSRVDLQACKLEYSIVSPK